jgi:hypothetical protein
MRLSPVGVQNVSGPDFSLMRLPERRPGDLDHRQGLGVPFRHSLAQAQRGRRWWKAANAPGAGTATRLTQS